MKADICLILEGTYPYVQGGVSSWIHDIVSNLQEFTFSIIHLSASGDVIRTPKYDLPPNIVEFKEAFVHDFNDDRSQTFGTKKEGWDEMRKFYNDLGSDDFSRAEKIYEMLIEKNTRRLNIHDMMFTRGGWDMLLELYENIAPEVSFVDFYWTMRFMHIPILNVFNIDLPEAFIYHTVCTGYAGLLAAISKFSKKVPLILTEHGIYTYERKIDISRSNWIYSESEKILRATRTLGFFKDLWINKFKLLSKFTYEKADKIVTLYEGNRRLQIESGAPAEKTMLIPNGVRVIEDPFSRNKKDENINNIGFIGRIVAIKDVKMLIRAIKIVKEKIENIKVYIMGSMEEEPQYADECKVLVKMLQLENEILFTGVVDVNEYYRLLDVMVLTSISEAQPLSILDAMSYGVPIVATDVGSCIELLYAKDSDDLELGKAGIITKIGDPIETGNAIIEILGDKGLAKQMGETGIKRIKKYYTIDEMVNSYRDLYNSFL